MNLTSPPSVPLYNKHPSLKRTWDWVVSVVSYGQKNSMLIATVLPVRIKGLQLLSKYHYYTVSKNNDDIENCWRKEGSCSMGQISLHMYWEISINKAF